MPEEQARMNSVHVQGGFRSLTHTSNIKQRQ